MALLTHTKFLLNSIASELVVFTELNLALSEARWTHYDNPKTPKPPCFLSDMSFVLRYDLIASDVNQCDSLIGKSRLIGFD